MADNFDAKFGAGPPPLPPPPPSLLAPHVLSALVLQFVVCFVVLLSIRPPFILRSSPRSDGAPLLDYGAVAVAAFLTIVASAALLASGTRPNDTFIRSCEFLYRISTA